MPESSAGKIAVPTAHDAAHDPGSVRDSAAFARFLYSLERSRALAIYGVDRQGCIVCWNHACSELYGVAAHQALGKPVAQVLQREQPARFAQTLEAAWSGLPQPPQDWRVESGQGRLWVYTVIIPMIEQGAVSRLVCLDADIGQWHRSERALARLGQDFRQLFEHSADAIVLMREQRFAQFNQAALQLFGYRDASELPSRYLEDFSPPLQRDGEPSGEKSRALFALAREQGNHRFEWLHIRRDGSQFCAEVLLTAIKGEGEVQMVGVIRDISARKAAEREQALAAQAFLHSREAVLIADRDRRVVSVNPAFVEITGYQPQQVVGRPARLLTPQPEDSHLHRQLRETLDTDGYWEGELWDRRQGGQAYPLWASVTAVRADDGRVGNYIAMFSDITHRKAAEMKARRLAEYDFLTGLPNRFLLQDRFGQAVAAARRKQRRLALLYLDLDRFKNVNDTLGHHIGDKLLQEVAARLKKCVRAVDTVSRRGGDEFVLLLADLDAAGQAAHVAENIMQQLNRPIRINGYECSVTASIGMSLYPDDGVCLDTLLEHADVAMYHAKEGGRNGCQFFNRDMNHRNVERLELEHSLKDALGKGEFYLEYLPEVEIASGRMTVAEALIRWRHPQFGTLSPARYIAVAEECGLGASIGEWVLNAACRQARAWQDAGMPMAVSVNLSAAQLRQKNLARTVLDALQHAGLEPAWLQLDIVEELMLGAADGTVEDLHALHRRGVRVALDDFGTGYSSLSSLTRFPVDKIKIDRSCTSSLDGQAHSIVGTIIAMAKSLNLKVIAEGVETEDQFRRLQDLGCDECQGHYLSQALPPAELRRLQGLG